MADNGSVFFAHLPFFLSLGEETSDLVHSNEYSLVFKILLQTGVRTSIMASPHALTNSAGMLSTPAEFSIFSGLTAASISSRRIGSGSSPGICGQSSTIKSPSIS